MNFISLEYLLIAPIICILFYIIPQKSRWVLLLCSSYFFYLYWNQWSVILLFGMTAFTFWAGKEIEKSNGRGWMILSAIICIGSIVISRAIDMPPVGISFYAFQTLSYVIDVYKGRVKAEKNFLFYMLHISFFPQLVAGPIERTENLLPQLHHLRGAGKDMIISGMQRILRGFFKKIVIADFISIFVDVVYENPAAGNGPASVFATLLFSVQIYCDFSGYTDIAVGTARILGIRLIENFNRPYCARDIQDFWKRWHISLTSWFQDYVYIPLGGNRSGFFRTCLNSMIIFLLSGIWHGTALTYLVWGGLHGLLVIADRVLKKANLKSILPPFISQIITYLLVCFTWIFFRAQTLGDAGLIIKSFASGWNLDGLQQASVLLGLNGQSLMHVLLCLLTLPALERIPVDYERMNTNFLKNLQWIFLTIILIGLGWLDLFSRNAGSSFIYFQF